MLSIFFFTIPISRYLGLSVMGLLIISTSAAQPTGMADKNTVAGYRSIWFTLGQMSEYGDKYSGGLGTYTAKHIPLAIYAPEVDKTFFVYGGTPDTTQRYLLCMIGSYDHQTHTVSRPVIVHDKQGVDDPHDNPSLAIDSSGYIWVFISGRAQKRPGFKYRSSQPYAITDFELVSEEEMTYPQPWIIAPNHFVHLFTKYTGVRELYVETSTDGREWSPDRKLAGIREKGDDKGGHYQVSNADGRKVATFFNRHPDGNVDKRTDLYYAQTVDGGETWLSITGDTLSLPITEVDHKSRVIDYQDRGKNVYLKDLNFDPEGNPICLHITSGGHKPGPDNAPYEWRIVSWDGSQWQEATICVSDHNYDMGSLYIDGNTWSVVGPTATGPQPYAAGGEIEIWESQDKGKTWQKTIEITQNSLYNHTYVRRPLRAKDPFYYFWADGDPTQFSTSRLYFGDQSGEHVWTLPLVMEGEHAEPIQIK